MFKFPNIFIKKVYLESDEATIEIVVKEKKDKVRRIITNYLDNTLKEENYKIRLYNLSSVQELEEVRKNNPVRTVPFYDIDFFNEVYVEEIGKQYHDYNKDLKRDLNSVKTNYISLQYNFRVPLDDRTSSTIFGIQMLRGRSYSSPVFEIVEANSSFALKASVFVDKKGGIWGKPVYFSNGDFYKDKNKQEILNRREFPNTSVINVKKFVEDFTLNFDFLEEDLKDFKGVKYKNFTSVNNKLQVKNLSVIDIKNILKDKSRFSSYFAQITDDQNKELIYRNSKIKNIRVSRISTSDNSNIKNFLAQTGQENRLIEQRVRYQDETKEKRISLINEEELDLFSDNSRFRYINFIDYLLKDKTSGEFKYFYEIEIEDGVKVFLESIFRGFRQINTLIDQYINVLSYNQDKFGNIKKDFQLPPNIDWKNIVQLLIENLSKLKPNFEAKNYIYLYSLLNPKNIQIKYLELIKKINDQIISNLSEITDIKLDDSYQYRSYDLTISVEFETKEAISTKAIKNGISYINTRSTSNILSDDNSFEKIKNSSLAKRSDLELRKYFKDAENITVRNNNKTYINNSDIRNDSISYLSPSGITLDDSENELLKGGASSYNLLSLGKIANKVIKMSTQKNTINENEIDFLTTNLNASENQELTFKDVFNNNWTYTGSFNEITSSDVLNESDSNNAYSTKKALGSVNQPQLSNFDVKRLDITREDNIIDKNDFGDLSGIPNQIKSLVALFDKNNKDKVNLDYLASDGESFDINYINEGSYLLNYILLGRVQYLADIQGGISGREKNLSLQNWERLTRNILENSSRKLFCRIDVDSSIMNIDTNPIKNFTIYSKYFIIDTGRQNNLLDINQDIISSEVINKIEEIDSIGSEFLNTGVFKI